MSKQAKFKIGGDNRKIHEIIKGRIIKEYKHFTLVETENGYRECISKNLLHCGDIERVI